MTAITAGEEEGRLLTSRAIRHEQTDVFGRVARRVERLDEHLAHLDPIPVPEGARRVGELGPGAGQQLDLAPHRQLADAGDIVVVLMGVDRVGDPEPMPARRLKIHLHVAPDVQHQRLACLLRAEEVGRVTEALEDELLEDHGRTNLAK
jgi:hypothetical protein